MEFDFLSEQIKQCQEDILTSVLEYEAVLRAINHLDSKHREVIVLRYLNDLTYNEIARILDIPQGTVKSRMNQAINTLRQQLRTQYQIGERSGL